MKYTDKEAVENYMVITIDDAFDAQIDEWIEAKSREADKIANRPLFREEEETYLYDGDGTDLLHIGDCTGITSVTIGGQAVEVAEYPANKGYTSRIRALNGRVFTRGTQNVAVTAIQGMHAELPEDIKLAVTMMVAEVVKANVPDSSLIANEKIGNYQAQYKASGELVALDAAKRGREAPEAIIKRYRRVTF